MSSGWKPRISLPPGGRSCTLPALLRGQSARVVVTIALLAAGCVAFLSSVLLLHLGLGSMPARYGVVVLVGYLSFLGLLRMAMWLKRKDVADRSLDVCV